MAAQGKTAVAVVTEEFVPLAEIMARNMERPGLRLCVLPYPLDTRPEPEVRQIARDFWQPLLASLGVPS
ncbi:MAG: hypothetical protein OXT07_15720 [bacterium]|nr:hypothetical protein [bacterium]MDE0217582.1 hypothetical protein [bacterium]